MEKKNNYGGKSDYRWSDEAVGAHLVTKNNSNKTSDKSSNKKPSTKTK